MRCSEANESYICKTKGVYQLHVRNSIACTNENVCIVKLGFYLFIFFMGSFALDIESRKHTAVVKCTEKHSKRKTKPHRKTSQSSPKDLPSCCI